ncbi:pentapeptide repeat-containing protein [Microvirga sp. 2MCAF38]|uniref:pentapeptide repeat-containing protein n=1 Tax=Microvirga sp. 2MCAF38 TaxID=3232989 RepID=UPI003F95689A
MAVQNSYLLFKSVSRVLRASGRGLTLFILIGFASVAHATCQDAPNPGVNWMNCSKTQLILADDDLSGGIFSRAHLTFTDFSDANLRGAKLNEAEISRARFEGADLSGADLSKAVGWRVDFNNANLANVNFSSVDVGRANFTGAKIAGSNFSKAEVNRSDFTGADLTGVDMSRAEAARVIFSNAKMAGMNFSYTNLSRAKLDGQDLTEVDMSRAYLFMTQIRGTNLSRAIGLTQEQLALACGTSETKLPQGLIAPKIWPCPEGDD